MMSGLFPVERIPATLPMLPIGAWPNLDDSWDNTLLYRKEINVDQAMQERVPPRSLLALKQNHTGLVAHEAVMVKHRARQVLMGMRTLDDQLQLVSWRVNADGSILRTGSSLIPESAVGIQQVRMARARNYVVACRTKTGEMQLSRWDVSNTGAIYLAGEHTESAQRIQWLEMAVLNPDHIVTFALTAAGRWQLALWHLQGEDAITLQQMEEIPATAVKGAVSGCGLGLFAQPDGTLGLITFSAATRATLSLQMWHYQPGIPLALVATQRIQSPTASAIIATQVSGDQLILVVQTVTGQLRLVTWQLAADGQAPFCQADRLLRAQVGYCTCQKHGDGFVLFYRTLAGELQIQIWQQPRAGTATLLANGHAPTAIGEVSCCDDRLDGNAPFLTATIDRKGEVTLTTWR